MAQLAIMDIMKIATRTFLGVPAIAAALLFSGCNDEEQAERVKELEEQNSAFVAEIEVLNRHLQDVQTQLRAELEQARNDTRSARDQLAEAQRQAATTVATLKAEAANPTRTAAKAAPAEETQKLIRDQLPAVWLIQGDQAKCRGIVAEADGKTWLYMPADLLSSSQKLTVTNAAGETVNKFGEFQMAADANLARLEITQDVPVKFTLGNQAPLGDNPKLWVALPATSGTALQLQEIRPGTVTASELELHSSGLSEAAGVPVFDAATGALVALIVPAPRATAELWQTSSGAVDSGSPRATRLDRPIDWQPTTIVTLLAERRKITELNNLSKLMLAAASLNPTTAGLRSEAMVVGGSQSVRQVFEQHRNLPIVMELLKLEDSLAGKKVRIAENDLKRQISSIFGGLGSVNRRVATELRSARFSPTHRQDAELALQWNQDAEQKLAAKLAEVTR